MIILTITLAVLLVVALAVCNLLVAATRRSEELVIQVADKAIQDARTMRDYENLLQQVAGWNKSSWSMSGTHGAMFRSQEVARNDMIDRAKRVLQKPTTPVSGIKAGSVSEGIKKAGIRPLPESLVHKTGDLGHKTGDLGS